jgi:hypothetical protein
VFHEVAGRVEFLGGTYAHESLLYLAHPSTFERIFVRSVKQDLADRLSELATADEPDVDRRIAQIREKLSERFGASVDIA